MVWSSGKYERWSSSASSRSVGLGYDNRPGELTVACRNRLFRYRFKLGKLAKRSFGFFESSISPSSSLPLWLCGELGVFSRSDEANMRATWEIRAAKRHRGLMHNIREKGAPHHQIPDDIFKRYEAFWRSLEYQAMRRANKANRASSTSGSLHTGGSIT
ncbi:hypothetical protein PIB30_048378 [Stylosanthes scabra]|uniref:Uncharacterized protein n=1 Tax=Stylosanthes scabra TaxID=79078 RepID=A0ABU6WF55_9FABA|nr:hypothetical protein [Stylosanthes scabra]